MLGAIHTWRSCVACEWVHHVLPMFEVELCSSPLLLVLLLGCYHRLRLAACDPQVEEEKAAADAAKRPGGAGAGGAAAGSS